MNDRELEHQKFTYLLALRRIVDNIPEIERCSTTSLKVDSRYESPSISNSHSIVPPESSMGSAHKATALLDAAFSQSVHENAIGSDDCRVLSTDFGFGRLSNDLTGASASLVDEFSKVGADFSVVNGSSTILSDSPYRSITHSNSAPRSVDFNLSPDNNSRGALSRGNTGGLIGPSRASSASSTTSSSISLLSNVMTDVNMNGNSSANLPRNVISQPNSSVVNMHPVPPVSVMSGLPAGQPPLELIDKFNTYVF